MVDLISPTPDGLRIRPLSTVIEIATASAVVEAHADPATECTIGASVGFFAAPDDRSLQAHVTGIVREAFLGLTEDGVTVDGFDERGYLLLRDGVSA